MPISNNRPNVSNAPRKVEYDSSRRVSLRPQDAEQTGLGPQVFDGTLIECGTEMFDYDGRYNSSPSIKGVFEVDDSGDRVTTHWRAGDQTKLSPTPDGTGFMPARNSASAVLGNSTNAYYFLLSLQKAITAAGFAIPDDFPENVKILEGIHGHFLRVDQPNRSNLKKEDDRPMTLYAAESVDSVPWSKPTATTTKVTALGRATPKAVPAPAVKPNGGDSGLSEEELAQAALAEAAISALEAEQGGPISLSNIGVEAFRLAPKTSPYRQRFVDYTEEELKGILGQDDRFKVQGKSVTLKV